MLNSEGNAILVAQNKIGSAATEVTDFSGNSKPVNIAFSTELTRAQDSISDQTTDVVQKNIVTAELNNLVENKVVDSATEAASGPSLVSQPILGSSTTLLKNLISTPDDIDDLRATNLGVRIVQTAESLINTPTTLEIDPAEIKQSQVPNNPIDPGSSLSNDIESSSPLDDSSLLGELKTASFTPGAVQTTQSENSQTLPTKIMHVQDENEALSTVPATIIPIDLPVGAAPEFKPAVQVLNSAPELDNLVQRPVAVPAEIEKITERLAITKTTAFTQTNGLAKEGIKDTEIKADGNQAVNTSLLYKPSPGLIESGLGRTSVELNNSANSTTQLIKPEVSSPTALGSPLLSSSISSSSIAETVSGEVAKVSGPDQLRSAGNVQTGPNDESLSNALRATSPVANVDESKQSVSFQAANNSASSIGLTNTPPSVTLNELAVPKGGANTVETSDAPSSNTDTIGKMMGNTNSSGTDLGGGESKNSHQHLTQGAVTTVDEDIALTPLRESISVEQQNKFSNVTPNISLRQALKPDQSSNLTSLQSLTAPAEITSSNVYHATSSGIITAHSTPLNTGLAADLASAPRTVLLDQAGADESLVDNLRWVVNEKLSRATINVSPANLGPITVSVDVENQNMNVSIIANSAAAKDAIDSLLPRMREHFSNEGYQQVSVDVSSQQERQGNLRNQSGYSLEQENGPEADSHDGELAHEENRPTFDNRHTSKSLIDTYV